MPRACFVFNPVGGSAVSHEALDEALGPLRTAGWQVALKATAAKGDASAIARQAVAEGCEVVVAAGGDGTVNEVLQALVHTETALGVLPLGTGNVWAREVGIPLELPGAVRVLTQRYERRVDVGLAGDRYFLLMAGIGYDASVTANTDAGAKRRLGMLAYVIKGVAVGWSYRGRRVTLESDGVRRHYRALLVVVGNTRHYGGPVQVTPRARIDDGLLDVCVFRGVSRLHAAWYVVMVLLGRHLRDHGVGYYRASNVAVTAEPAQLVQVDGDVIGHTPMVFTVKSRALRVILPRGGPPGLFGPD